MTGLIKAICYTLLAILCTSCFSVDCDKLATILRPKECNIVVEDTPERGRRFTIKGINPETNQRVTYSDVNTWYVFFNDKIEVGDTVVKRNGELTFYIHKADTTLAFPYECEGKVFE
ncbi:hypothetical protein GCM10011323_32270 [Pontibacter amylolyticus]|uniref:Uncharacterized protein n=1 Tax=Pontibacter amylolyticus TaxID=1424080 RepID=A0ABQ1WE65_9BACT|nr:hypothetical protein GCM10011323_32270 [Pontibacter amylolyticus]